jgi:hypothetical protein
VTTDSAPAGECPPEAEPHPGVWRYQGTPGNLGAEIIAALLGAVELADRIGDDSQAGAFEVTLDHLRRWAPWTPAGIMAVIRAFDADGLALVDEAMRYDHDCATVGAAEAAEIRAAAKRDWENRTVLGLPPVPPMIPDAEQAGGA